MLSELMDRERCPEDTNPATLANDGDESEVWTPLEAITEKAAPIDYLGMQAIKAIQGLIGGLIN